MTLKELPADEIAPNPRNPRQHFDEDALAELTESIREQGLLQAVLVRPTDEGDGYELVHGERRLRAVKELGWDTIRAEIRDLGDKEALEVSITENLQREDVSPIEEARGVAALIEEFDLTQAEAAQKIGKSRSHVANQLGLLNLPDLLQRSVLHKTLSPWQARTLNSVWGEYWLWDLTVDHGLSVTELREVISDLKQGREFVYVEREWPIDALKDDLWNAEDEGELLGLDEEEEVFSIATDEFHQFHLWAKQHIDGYDRSLDHDDKYEMRPVVCDMTSMQVVNGYTRVRMADEHGYDGDMKVKMTWPRRIFEWGRVLEGGDTSNSEADD